MWASVSRGGCFLHRQIDPLAVLLGSMHRLVHPRFFKLQNNRANFDRKRSQRRRKSKYLGEQLDEEVRAHSHAYDVQPLPQAQAARLDTAFHPAREGREQDRSAHHCAEEELA